jgi:hypothetical protein
MSINTKIALHCGGGCVCGMKSFFIFCSQSSLCAAAAILSLSLSLNTTYLHIYYCVWVVNVKGGGGGGGGGGRVRVHKVSEGFTHTTTHAATPSECV